MIKKMKMEDYVKEYNKLRQGQYIKLEIYLPYKVSQKLGQIARMVGTKKNIVISHMLTQLALQYDYEHMLLPDLKFIVDDTGEDDE